MQYFARHLELADKQLTKQTTRAVFRSSTNRTLLNFGSSADRGKLLTVWGYCSAKQFRARSIVKKDRGPFLYWLVNERVSHRSSFILLPLLPDKRL
jgi:hypothetical protein